MAIIRMIFEILMLEAVDKRSYQNLYSCRSLYSSKKAYRLMCNAIQKLSCTACKRQILPETSAKNSGLCMPCKGNYRAMLDRSLADREKFGTFEIEHRYWMMLYQRISRTGIEQLGLPKQTYLSVREFMHQVGNGGHEQYFSNSSGAHYGYALNGLFEIDAIVAAALLEKVKRVLFGDKIVPLDSTKRNTLMQAAFDARGSEIVVTLREIDDELWSHSERINRQCLDYALAHRLFKLSRDVQ